MNDYISYLESGKVTVIKLKNPWDVVEWQDICREAGAYVVGIGSFKNKLNAQIYMEDLYRVSSVYRK